MRYLEQSLSKLLRQLTSHWFPRPVVWNVVYKDDLRRVSLSARATDPVLPRLYLLGNFVCCKVLAHVSLEVYRRGRTHR